MAEVAWLNLSRPLTTIAGPPLPQWRVDVAIQRWNNTVAHQASIRTEGAHVIDLADFASKRSIFRAATGTRLPKTAMAQAYLALEEWEEATVSTTVHVHDSSVTVPAALPTGAAEHQRNAPSDNDAVCIRLAPNVTLYERDGSEHDHLEPVPRLIQSTVVDGPRPIGVSSGQVFQDAGRALAAMLGAYRGDVLRTGTCPDSGGTDAACARAEMQQQVLPNPGHAVSAGSFCSCPFGPVHLGLGAVLARSFELCCREHARAYSDCDRLKSDADDAFQGCMDDATARHSTAVRSAISLVSATAADELIALSVQVHSAQSAASALYVSASRTAVACSQHRQRQREHCGCPGGGTLAVPLPRSETAMFPALSTTHVRLFADANSSSIARLSSPEPPRAGNILLLDVLAAHVRAACNPPHDLEDQSWLAEAFRNATAPSSIELPPCSAVSTAAGSLSPAAVGFVVEAQLVAGTGGIAMAIASLSSTTTCADKPCLGNGSTCSMAGVSGDPYCHCGTGRSGPRCETVAGAAPAVLSTCAVSHPVTQTSGPGQPSPPLRAPTSKPSPASLGSDNDGVAVVDADGFPAWAAALCVAVALAIAAAIFGCRRKSSRDDMLPANLDFQHAQGATSIGMVTTPMIDNASYNLRRLPQACTSPPRFTAAAHLSLPLTERGPRLAEAFLIAVPATGTVASVTATTLRSKFCDSSVAGSQTVLYTAHTQRWRVPMDTSQAPLPATSYVVAGERETVAYGTAAAAPAYDEAATGGPGSAAAGPEYGRAASGGPAGYDIATAGNIAAPAYDEATTGGPTPAAGPARYDIATAGNIAAPTYVLAVSGGPGSAPEYELSTPC